MDNFRFAMKANEVVTTYDDFTNDLLETTFRQLGEDLDLFGFADEYVVEGTWSKDFGTDVIVTRVVGIRNGRACMYNYADTTDGSDHSDVEDVLQEVVTDLLMNHDK